MRREIPNGVRHDENTGVDYVYAGGAFCTARIREAKARGEWDIPRDNGAIFSVPGRVEIVSVNLTRVFVDDPTDLACLARADAEGRAQVEQCVRFFRAYLPGFERAEPGGDGPADRRAGKPPDRGLYELTGEDAVTCRQFEDVIAQCCYGLDEHKPGSQTWAMDHRFAEGEHYDIPWRCPCRAPGRPISSSRAAPSRPSGRRCPRSACSRPAWRWARRRA